MVVIMIYIQEVQTKNRFQDTKKLMNYKEMGIIRIPISYMIIINDMMRLRMEVVLYETGISSNFYTTE